MHGEQAPAPQSLTCHVAGWVQDVAQTEAKSQSQVPAAELSPQHRAAVRIQARFRGYAVRKVHQACCACCRTSSLAAHAMCSERKQLDGMTVLSLLSACLPCQGRTSRAGIKVMTTAL